MIYDLRSRRIACYPWDLWDIFELAKILSRRDKLLAELLHACFWRGGHVEYVRRYCSVCPSNELPFNHFSKFQIDTLDWARYPVSPNGRGTKSVVLDLGSLTARDYLSRRLNINVVSGLAQVKAECLGPDQIPTTHV